MYYYRHHKTDTVIDKDRLDQLPEQEQEGYFILTIPIEKFCTNLIKTNKRISKVSKELAEDVEKLKFQLTQKLAS